MRLLALYLGRHDSNVAVAVEGRVRYAKSERRTGVKHHHAGLGFVRERLEEWGVRSVDAIAFSDGNSNGLGACEIGELAREASPLWGTVPTFCLDHHYAHILSAWPVVDLDDVDVGIAIDGGGDHQVRTRVVERPGSLDARSVFHSTRPTYGMLLNQIGRGLRLSGDRLDFAGKVMGLQAYGSVDAEFLESVASEDLGDRVWDLLFTIPWRGIVPASASDFFRFECPSFRDWLASVHAALERQVLGLFHAFARRDETIVFSGGCAQNTVYNEALARDFPHLHIPPHCYDGGMSLGCLEFLRMYYGQPKFSTQGFPFWQDEEDTRPLADDTVRTVARLLSQGKIVGWFQGRGEIGPRALGHRSILMDPRGPDAKEVLNRTVKHREPWRPYAPSILESCANEWFELDRPTSFMLRAVPARAERSGRIPAVVHADQTSRIQTVPEETDDDLAPFARLLADFREETGVPLLLNTSLNRGGGPIFGKPSDALDFFRAVPLDALCVGDELFVK